MNLNYYLKNNHKIKHFYLKYLFIYKFQLINSFNGIKHKIKYKKQILNLKLTIIIEKMPYF